MRIYLITMVIGIGMYCTWMNPPTRRVVREPVRRIQPHLP